MLAVLSTQLSHAYQRGLKFSRMGPVSQWQAAQEAKRAQKRGRGRYRVRASS